MPLTLLEEEVVDVLRDKGPLTGPALQRELGWGAGKLYQALAALEERKVITTKWEAREYPTPKALLYQMA